MTPSLSTDFLIRIKNGSRASRKTITAPSSKYCVAIATLLKKYGYIDNFSVSAGPKPEMTITLAYDGQLPRIYDLHLLSKPGRRLYEKNHSLPWGKTKQSLIIVSTSSGVMSQKEAKVKGIGGEIVAEIW
jgi:small subunit ribosomal protein S8